MQMEIRAQLDETQFARARQLTGIQDPEQLMQHVLTRFLQLEAMGRLARMGGTMPDLSIPPRWRPEDPRDVDERET